MNIIVSVALVVAGSDQVDGAALVGITDTVEHCQTMVAIAERQNADYLAKLAERGIVPVGVCTMIGAQPALPETKVPPRKDDTPT